MSAMPSKSQMASDTHPAMLYPKDQQYARWQARADEMDMSMSGFMESMIEAGLKKFDAIVEPDQSNLKLREQRDDVKAELDKARERVRKLEEQLYASDAAEMKRYVRENQGADFEDITDHLKATVPERTNAHIAVFEGDVLEVENGRFYATDEADETYGETDAETEDRREVTFADV